MTSYYKNMYIEQFSLELNVHTLINNEIFPLHLQWFAAEDEGRSFDPTERKIQKAKEEGRVAKTQEIPSSLVLIAVVALIWMIGSYYVNNFKNMFFEYFFRINTLMENGFANEGIAFGTIVFRLLWPVVLLTVIMGIFGNIIQFGWAPSLKPITPDFSKVKFKVSKWIERITSIQGWYNTGTAVLKITAVTVIVIVNITINMEKIVATVDMPFEKGVLLSIQIIFMVLLESGIFLFGLAIIDYQFQKFLFLDQLKMTFQDIKEEFKESEGDAEVKRRIKYSMQEFMNRNVKQEVTNSDVLVTNPTHFAIALKYDQSSMIAPKITAKGEDQYALRMKRIAKDEDVPIIENKPLARALYADLNVGDEIPEKYYGAVVLVFQEVYKMKGMYTDG